MALYNRTKEQTPQTHHPQNKVDRINTTTSTFFFPYTTFQSDNSNNSKRKTHDTISTGITTTGTSNKRKRLQATTPKTPQSPLHSSGTSPHQQVKPTQHTTPKHATAANHQIHTAIDTTQRQSIPQQQQNPPATHINQIQETIPKATQESAHQEPPKDQTLTTSINTHKHRDNRAFGDPITNDPTPYCRILLQNINGLQDKPHQLGSRAQELQLSILGLVETNTDWDWKQTKTETTAILRRYFTRTSFAFSSSVIRFDSIFQPGGTMTIAMNKWGARATPSNDTSSMGRWSSQTIKGKMNKAISIYSVYRVCDQKFATAGVKTAFRQQYIISANNGTSPNDPRHLILADLGTEITKNRNNGHGIIVLIDANESLTKHNSKFAKWIQTMELTDPITLRHGPAAQPASVDHGSTRIDFILTSADLNQYIKAAGILPRFHFIDSDHRALFLDLDLDQYLHGIPSETHAPTHRGISSDNPKAVIKYQRELLHFLNTSDVEAQLEKLVYHNNTNGSLTQQMQHHAIALDNTITNAKLKAETSSSHIIKRPWSPKLIAAQNTALFWDSLRRQPKCRTDGTDYRTRLCPDLAKLPPPTLTEIKASLKAAQNNFKEAKMNAAELRFEHLEDLAQLYANTGRTSKSNIVKQLQRRETCKGLYNQCNSVLRRPKPTPVTHVIVTNPDGSKTTLMDQTQMERAFTDRNRAHFSQADGTPFTAYPIVTTYGPNGINTATKQLLQGNITIPEDELSEATKTLLHNLPLPNVPPIDNTLYTTEVMASFRGWNEKTSTSPRGDHLGHDHPPEDNTYRPNSRRNPTTRLPHVQHENTNTQPCNNQQHSP